MGAGDSRWHEHGPVKDGDPIVSPSILLLMRGQGGAEQSVLPWEADREAAFSPESMPAGSPESEDILANLLRAIENTQIAASFPSLAPPESGHHPARISAQTEEVVGAFSPLLQEPAPRMDAAARREATPDDDAESDEALSKLLRALQDTEIAATLEGIQQADYAEPVDSACAQPAESAEAAFTTSEKREADVDAHVGSTPESALESESAAMAMAAFIRAEADARLEGAPGQIDDVAPEIMSSGEEERAGTTPISQPPDFRARRTRRQDGHPKRVVRRRNSDRGRSDYLLSVAASTPAGPSPAVDNAQVAEPLPAVAATVSAEPERPSTTKPELTDDTLILPAARGGGTLKGRIRVRLGTGIGNLAATGELINGGLDRAEMHLENWFQKWLGPPDPRRNARVDNPPLVAYHWIADVSQALKIADISAGGLHLVTKDRWSEGNIISMTLQRTDREKGSPDSWIAVDFLVMRWCEDGMAGAFMASTPGLAYTVAGRAGNCADRKMLVRFVDRLADAAADRLAGRR